MSLDQEPIVEGALVAIDNRTGHILAMVGGYDFARSKFNRAVQAQRQLTRRFTPPKRLDRRQSDRHEIGLPLRAFATIRWAVCLMI